MDLPALSLVLSLVPRLPQIAHEAVRHLLRLSPTWPYLDLRSAVAVAILRHLLSPSRPRSISSTQQLTMLARNRRIRGRLWVAAAVVSPPPESDLRDALMDAIAILAVDLPPARSTSSDSSSTHSTAAASTATATAAAIASAATTCRIPDLVSVEAEWTAHRSSATSPDEPLPTLPDNELYSAMMASPDCSAPTTILYLHGGAYYLCDPATHRSTTAELARLTRGRCYSVRYRLAPQYPFPAALLDALISYMALLYPPLSAFHRPVDPAHLVLAGDSAGGGLCLALLQILLHLHRERRTIAWYGRDRPVPLPAAIAVSSPWLDLTQSSASWRTNIPFDYLPTPPARTPPPCPAWPTDPPRHSLYVDDTLLGHPLASPIVCPSWVGAPPVYLCSGWELLADEHSALAAVLARRDAVPVLYEQYRAMPHCFALVLPRAAASRRCLASWAAFIHAATCDPAALSAPRLPTAVAVAESLAEVALEFDDLAWPDITRRVHAAAAAVLARSPKQETV